MNTQATPTNNNQPVAMPEAGKVTRIPGVKFDVSPGKEVIIRIPGKDQSYRGKIVGFEPYEFIIAKVRLPSSVRQDLKLGGNLVIKYVHEGTVYGFRAAVHNAISSPAQLVFFEYPDVIEKLALRRTLRLECNIDSLLHTTEDEVECMVVNVSESGCKISARANARGALHQTKVDDALIVAMHLGSYGELKVAVAVKNVTNDKGIISMGCMFLDITKEEMAAIQNYLEKISRYTA